MKNFLNAVIKEIFPLVSEQLTVDVARSISI